MKKVTIVQLVSGVCIVVGLCGVVPTLYYRHKLSTVYAAPVAPVQAPPAAQQPTAKPVVSGVPVQVSVEGPAVQNVPVVEGVYNPATREWNVGLTTAHFATITSPANDTAGNTYIYGHYRPEVFAALHTARVGALARVVTNNGYEFTYQLQEVKTLSPADTSVCAYQGAPILTMQTCSGFWFQNRQQFTFSFVSYKKL